MTIVKKKSPLEQKQIAGVDYRNKRRQERRLPRIPFRSKANIDVAKGNVDQETQSTDQNRKNIPQTLRELVNFVVGMVGFSKTKKNTTSLVKCEFIEESDGQAICWVEIASGLRVRSYFPLQPIHDLKLTSGDEFLWDLESHEAAEIPIDPSEEEEWKRIGEELRELNREFHQELEHQIPDIDDE